MIIDTKVTNFEEVSLGDDLRIIKADLTHSSQIWEWRNDPISVKMSFTRRKISWEEHGKWFSKILSDKNCILLLGQIRELTNVGMCRFDIDFKNKLARISINLNPNFRNKNLSTEILKKSINLFFKKYNYSILATIKNNNIASIACFKKCNFNLIYQFKGYSIYMLKKEENQQLLSKLELISEIEKIRSANNINWMDLLRLAFINAPEETKLLIRKINSDDNKISTLFAKLGE